MTDERDVSAPTRAEELLNAFLARNQEGGKKARVVLDAAAVEIFDALSAAEVDAVLLKGAGLRQLLYKPGEHRSYVDIDLLVNPSDLGRAEAVLRGLGYRNTAEHIATDDAGAVVHADTWLGPLRGGIESLVPVELHRWLPGAKAAPEAAWPGIRKHLTSVELGARPVPVLTREGQALQLATHAAQHGRENAKGIMELSLALERWPIDVWAAAADLAFEIDATSAFGAGLRLTERGAKLAKILGLPAADAADWEVRHLYERPRGVFHLDMLQAARSQRDLLQVLRRALWPDRHWLARDFRFAKRGALGTLLAHVLHLLRAPLWAGRAWRFRRRQQRTG